MAKFDYYPAKLTEAKLIVKDMHPSTNDNFVVPKMDDHFKRTVIRLSKLDPEKIKAETIVLSNVMVDRIAAYLPFNTYNVAMDNLFTIYVLRSSERLANVLFNSWQNAYTSFDCNFFIRQRLLTSDEHFNKKCVTRGMDANLFSEILGSEDIVYALGVAKKRLSPDSLYNVWLLSVGINEDSQLYKDYMNMIFTFCSRQDYLNAGEKPIVNAVKTYSESQIKHFIVNFIGNLSHADYSRYEGLLDLLVSVTNEPGTERFTSFFIGVDTKIIDRYRNWIHSKKLDAYFEKDERSAFWKKYAFESIYKDDKRSLIIMRFKNHYAIEFLGKAMGPIYIYKKDYYEKEIRGPIHRLDNKHQTTDFLYNHTRYGDGDFRGSGYRKAHRGFWQSEVANALRRYGVANLAD